MSELSMNTTSFAISLNSDDEDMKRKLLECLGVTAENVGEDELFDGIYSVPETLEKLSTMEFLESDCFINDEKTLDLFLLLNKIFDETYLIQGDEWFYDDDFDWDEDSEDDDEDEEDDDDWEEDLSGENNGSKDVRLFDPVEEKKSTYILTIHEVLDMDGGSNGADVDFDMEAGIKEEKIEKKEPGEDFIKEIISKAQEKGYTDLVDLINNH